MKKINHPATLLLKPNKESKSQPHVPSPQVSADGLWPLSFSTGRSVVHTSVRHYFLNKAEYRFSVSIKVGISGRKEGPPLFFWGRKKLASWWDWPSLLVAGGGEN